MHKNVRLPIAYHVIGHPGSATSRNFSEEHCTLCTGKHGNISVYVGQHPAGTSVRNIVHYVQVSNVVFLCM